MEKKCQMCSYKPDFDCNLHPFIVQTMIKEHILHAIAFFLCASCKRKSVSNTNSNELEISVVQSKIQG